MTIISVILAIIAIVFLCQIIFNFKKIIKKHNDHDLKQIRKIEEVSEEELKELRKDVKQLINEILSKDIKKKKLIIPVDENRYINDLDKQKAYNSKLPKKSEKVNNNRKKK